MVQNEVHFFLKGVKLVLLAYKNKLLADFMCHSVVFGGFCRIFLLQMVECWLRMFKTGNGHRFIDETRVAFCEMKGDWV